MPDGTLIFDTKIDKDGFEAGLKQLERATNNLGSTFKGVLGGNIASQLLSRGTETLVDMAKQAVTTASDLAEVQNVVDVTFGDSAESIDRFAKSAMTNFGLTELQAKQYSSTMGAMLKSMGLSDDLVLSMSEDMTALVGDMASFYNLDHETAFQKIRSGLSGETEPLKQLGINLSVANLEAYALAEGLGKTYEEMTEAERANLRFSYIMAATTDAQGDFVRTSDGFANQLRIMQGNLTNIAAEVGANLLPALTTGMQMLNSFLSGGFGNNETIDQINEVSSAFAGIEGQIQDIRNNYARTTVSISMDYKQAAGLIEDIGRLQTLKAAGADVDAQLISSTDALVAIYPQLAKYVGEDGIMSLGVEGLRAANDEIRELAKNTAYLAMVSEMEGVYYKAETDFAFLAQQKNNAEEQMRSLQEQIDLLNKLDTLDLASDSLLRQGMLGEINAEEVKTAVQAYLDLFGGLESVDTSGIDLDAIFDMEGEMLATADLFAMLDLLNAIANKSGVEEGVREQYAEAESTLAAAETALADASAAYLYAAEQLELAEQTYNNRFGIEAETTDYTANAERIMEELQYNIDGKKLHVGVGELAIENIDEHAPEIRKAVQDAVPDSVDVKINPVVDNSVWGWIKRMFSGGSADGSHATGLDRVPYDNYLARLHVGEAVLSASEAERWRDTKGGIDYGAMADAIASALPDGSVTPVIHLYVDGVELANNQASNNRTALATRSTIVARGYGKR